MNKPATIDTATPASLLEMARSVASGCAVMLPRVEHEYYDFSEWQEAAREALESDDLTLLDHMLARETAYNEFRAWQSASYTAREFEDFGNWLDRKAMWNRPNRYEIAQTYLERRAA